MQLAGRSSYSRLFDSSSAFASPVAHFWSLAIEGQFYLIWPVMLIAFVRIAGRRSQRLVIVLGAVTLAFAAVAPVIAAVWGADAAYWATPARLGELLDFVAEAEIIADAILAEISHGLAGGRRFLVIPGDVPGVPPISLRAVTGCSAAW